MSNIEDFVQLISGPAKSDKRINTTGFDKIHLNCGCFIGRIVDDVRESFLYSFALDKPPDHEIQKEQRIKLLKKIIKFFLSHITFYLEDVEHKPMVFINETIRFICQLVKY